MSDYKTCRTVGQLIEELTALDPESLLIGDQPPFDGVMIVPQNSGLVMICSPEQSNQRIAGDHPMALSVLRDLDV